MTKYKDHLEQTVSIKESVMALQPTGCSAGKMNSISSSARKTRCKMNHFLVIGLMSSPKRGGMCTKKLAQEIQIAIS